MMINDCSHYHVSNIVRRYVWQEREISLDAVMERTRQEATDAGLKDGLKKSLQLLDNIRARYLRWFFVMVRSIDLGPEGIEDPVIQRLKKSTFVVHVLYTNHRAVFAQPVRIFYVFLLYY